MIRFLKNCATLAILGIPLWVIVIGAVQGQPATLKVHLMEPDAEVWVDGQMVFTTGRVAGPMRLDPGGHSLRVMRGDQMLYGRELNLAPGAEEEVRARWDPASAGGRSPCEMRRFEGHAAPVTCLAFSPDGRRAYSGSEDLTIRAWDLNTGAELTNLRMDHQHKVTSLAVSPDGRRLLSGSQDVSVRCWDLETGRQLWMGSAQRIVRSVAISPDGKLGVSTADDLAIRLWNLESGEEVGRLTGAPDFARSARFSPDGARVLAGFVGLPGGVNPVRVWDLATRESLWVLKGHDMPVWSVDFTPDGMHVVSGSSDESIRLWDLQNGKELLHLEGSEGTVLCVTVSANGRLALSGNGAVWNNGWVPASAYRMRLWDLKTGKSLAQFNHGGQVRCVAFSPDGNFALSGSENLVRYWDLRGFVGAGAGTVVPVPAQTL
jgi:WD40 repeat protein